ncbi:MAG: FtsX-like permease family protein [Luteitalea sp.]|nr:FtsX-like permease family protein [Luteitalea sp.]
MAKIRNLFRWRRHRMETWMWRWLDAFVRDVRYALRSLAKSRGFALALAVGAVLALAIGANTAIFSVVNTVLLQPLAYPDAERIVSVETFRTNTGRSSPEVSGPDFLDWQQQNSVFELMAYSGGGEDDLTTVVGGRAEFANVRGVSADFFAVFGQPPSAGRFLTRRDADAKGAVSAVVSHHWAETHFGSAEAAVGKPFTIYTQAAEIVGVAPPGFHYPGAVDIWGSSGPTDRENRSEHRYRVIGKLKSGVDLAGARAQMRTIGDRLAQQYPDNRSKTVAVIPLQERLTGDVRVTVWVLMGAVLSVLLIACANIANLLLARSAARTRELALRAALGADRGRVVRQLLSESVVLGGLAALAGLILAYVLVRALVAMSPADLPRVDEVRIDVTVLLFALGLSLVSTLLFGLVPALHASRLDLSDALKQGGSMGTVSGGGGRLRSALVVAEVALSVMLLVAAGLLLRSFQVLHQVDLGFTTERVLVAYTQYPASNEEARHRRIRFYRDLLERVRAVPGVRAASGVAFLPLGREPRPAVEYFVQGRPEGRRGQRPTAEFQAIAPEYFKTMGIPLRRGRDFDETDTRDRPPVAIINESLARAAFPNESPLRKRIRSPRTGPEWMEIVGVVADTRWRDPSQPPPPELFAAAATGVAGSMSILVRTSLDEKSLASTLRTLLQEMDATVPARFETMKELFADRLAYPRFRTQLIGAFAGMAALLAAVGIFSLLAYLVGQRTNELAVRRAVGAQAADVVRLIAAQGLRLVAIGLVLGLVGALAAARLLEGLLYEISPWDVGTYLGVVVVIGIAAMLATLLPAIRAATIDPLIALRHE